MVKDYGQMPSIAPPTIASTPDTPPTIEVGFDADGGKWWYRIETATLARYLRLAGIVSEEVSLNFTDTGFYSRIVDPSHVSLMSIATPGNPVCLENSPVGWVRLDVKELNECLDKAETHITLVIDGDESNTLLEVINENCRTTLTGRSTPGLEPRIPDIDFEATVTVCGRDFTKAVKRISSISQLAVLSLTPHEEGALTGDLTLSSPPTTGFTNRTYTLLKDEATPEGCTIESIFSTQYLGYLCKGLPAIKRDAIDIAISWGPQNPCHVTGVSDLVEWSYFLAPRIEGDA